MASNYREKCTNWEEIQTVLLNLFKEIVDELAEIICKPNKSESVAKLIASIKNTISDQSSVNPCSSKRLHTLREDLLPVAIEN